LFQYELFLGVQEVAELLGVRPKTVRERRKSPEFPTPIAVLACGPIWQRSAIIQYSVVQAVRFEERPCVVRLADEAAEVLPTEPSLTLTVGAATRRSAGVYGAGRELRGRDAVALALATVEEDDDLMDAILGQYSLHGDELVLVVTLARLVDFAAHSVNAAEGLDELAWGRGGAMSRMAWPAVHEVGHGVVGRAVGGRNIVMRIYPNGNDSEPQLYPDGGEIAPSTSHARTERPRRASRRTHPVSCRPRREPHCNWAGSAWPRRPYWIARDFLGSEKVPLPNGVRVCEARGVRNVPG
jgi:hypothetical protein